MTSICLCSHVLSFDFISGSTRVVIDDVMAMDNQNLIRIFKNLVLGSLRGIRMIYLLRAIHSDQLIIPVSGLLKLSSSIVRYSIRFPSGSLK